MEDRRRFFRINDRVSLKYRVVQNNDVEAEIQRVENEQNELAELRIAFNSIDTQIQHKLERAQENSPLLADVLSLFDKKLLLMQNVLLQGGDSKDLLTNLQEVNLSASGMSFEANTPLNEGTLLKMDMVLFPEYQYLPLQACVVNCRKKIDDTLYRFLICVEFIDVKNKLQEEIMQHVLNKQSAELQQQRQQLNTAVNC
ncbi:MAG: PilZ domain-containing protein [Pseudomonadota bacterium]